MNKVFLLWKDSSLSIPVILANEQVGGASLQEARLLASKLRKKEGMIYLSAEETLPPLNKRRELRRQRAMIGATGIYHNLEVILEKVRKYLPKINVAISWSKESTIQKRVRSIKFGMYMPKLHVIKIHPALDQEWVPEIVIESIIYHELLHIMIPPYKMKKRKIIHSKEFRNLEKKFPHYANYITWKAIHKKRFIPGTSLEQLKENFLKLYEKYGLKKEDLGRRFKNSKGNTYDLVGIKPRRFKYPIIGCNINTGIRGKFSSEWVKEHWEN